MIFNKILNLKSGTIYLITWRSVLNFITPHKSQKQAGIQHKGYYNLLMDMNWFFNFGRKKIGFAFMKGDLKVSTVCLEFSLVEILNEVS